MRDLLTRQVAYKPVKLSATLWMDRLTGLRLRLVMASKTLCSNRYRLVKTTFIIVSAAIYTQQVQFTPSYFCYVKNIAHAQRLSSA